MTPERDAELRSRILDLVSAYWEEAHPQEPFEPGRTTVNVAGKVVDTSELRNLVDASLDLWLTTGRYAERFEREFARWMGIREAVLVNAAFAVVAGGKAEEVREGVAVAARSIDSGAAMDRLRAFLAILGSGGRGSEIGRAHV